MVPVYDEADKVTTLLDRVWACRDPGGWATELILVDDGSSDGSAERVRAWMDRLPVPDREGIRFFVQGRNQGKWAALRRGFREARGEVLLVQDADLELDPAQYPQLLAPFDAPEVKAVYGVRACEGSAQPALSSRVANRVLSTLTSCLFLSRIRDMETGYKALRREVLESLSLEACRFEGEPEVTAKVLRLGCRIRQVPVRFTPRTHIEGKKIGFKDGVEAVLELIRWRLVPMAWWRGA